MHNPTVKIVTIQDIIGKALESGKKEKTCEDSFNQQRVRGEDDQKRYFFTSGWCISEEV